MKANLDGAKIAYESFGSGPALVVLHDGPSNREIGGLFAPLVEGGYRVVVTHLDGFCRRPGSADLAGWSNKTVALLNFLGIGRAVFIGIGQGGIVLLDILKSHPQRVAASSLVIGSATARQIRALAERFKEGALEVAAHDDFEGELLRALPVARKEKTASSPLSSLRSWINGVCSKNFYSAIIQHRSASRAELDVPPMIIETDEGKAGKSAAKTKSSRSFRSRFASINAHLAALFNSLYPPDEEEEEEEALDIR